MYVKQDQANGLDLIHVAPGMVTKIKVALEMIVMEETYRVNLKPQMVRRGRKWRR